MPVSINVPMDEFMDTIIDSAYDQNLLDEVDIKLSGESRSGPMLIGFMRDRLAEVEALPAAPLRLATDASGDGGGEKPKRGKTVKPPQGSFQSKSIMQRWIELTAEIEKREEAEAEAKAAAAAVAEF